MNMDDKDKSVNILCLDGGGSKGVFTLGVLRELEKKLKGDLFNHFDFIYGVSTGSIIAACLAVGMAVEEIKDMYMEHIPYIMNRCRKKSRSIELSKRLNSVFRDYSFENLKTDLVIVATNCDNKRPMIFKSNANLAHGLKASFVPGFGCDLAEAVEASCSAYPFFEAKRINTSNQEEVFLVDGGFVANNPSLVALIDVLNMEDYENKDIRLLSIGVGEYPKKTPKKSLMNAIRHFLSKNFIFDILEINSNTIEKQFEILSSGKCKTLRINESFIDPKMATSLFESDKNKLMRMLSRGRETFGKYEKRIDELLG